MTQRKEIVESATDIGQRIGECGAQGAGGIKLDPAWLDKALERFKSSTTLATAALVMHRNFPGRASR